MNKTKNNRLTENSKDLRHNMTAEEAHLWYDFLKKLPITVNRRKVIGKYIVDFYCAEAKLVIELDSRQHGKEEHRLRYKNTDINKKFRGVCMDIIAHIPSLQGYFDDQN